MTTVNSMPFGAVHVIGAGLLGASCGLALRDRGVRVTLEDSSPSALSLAVDYGAGRRPEVTDSEPDLVIVATPPDVTASVVIEALNRFPKSVVIDVASVKGAISQAVDASGVDASRYLPTHPMAGRERGGAVSARSDLFTARPWVICDGDPGVVATVAAAVKALEATPIMMSVAEHDTAVALMSHAPQLVASIMAARLASASDEALALAGGGVRDVTRIAASDPTLWTHIVHANGEAIHAVLSAIRDDLDQVLSALLQGAEAGSRKVIASVLKEGNQGVSRLPGKHGVSTRFASLLVVIDDKPGELARLLTELGQWKVNLEDLRIEHSPGAAVGFVDLTLAKDSVSSVEAKLHAAGWRIAGEIE